ncbi:hypothetical protein KW798_01535 [Candidatus Parcubacteria bacterium]|nr:hypothetical protein [Candidatus Parcubacteria bacterium]
MVRGLSALGREIRGMHQAAYLLAAFAFLSQLLGLVRDRLLAGEFGATHTLDVYYAAFRIPDFLFATVASLLSLYALLPALTLLLEENEGYMVSFMRQILLVFFVAMALLACVLFVLTPWLVHVILPGIASDPASKADLVMLVRILLLQPILLGASNILAALTQLRHRFFLYSVSPLLYNLGIIFGIVALYPMMGVSGLAWGVVLGALMHLLIQLPFFFAEKSHPLPMMRVGKELTQVLLLSIPRTFTLASGQLLLLVFTAFASYLAPGSIAVFTFAWNLQAVPLTIIGVSYSVAAFPTLTRLYSAGAWGEFTRHIEVALRHMLFWAVPAMVFVIVLRAQLVRTILGSGIFDWDATRLVAAALALFIISLCAQSVNLLIARAYYAAGKTMLPLYLSCVGVLSSVGSAIFFIWLFHESLFTRLFLEALLRVSDMAGTTILMLALSFAFGSIVQAGLSLYRFSKDFSLDLTDVRRLTFQSFAASVIGGAVAYAGLATVGRYVDINTAPGVLLQGIVGGTVGLAATIFVLVILHNQELAEAFSTLKRKFEDYTSVAVEPTDVS